MNGIGQLMGYIRDRHDLYIRFMNRIRDYIGAVMEFDRDKRIQEAAQTHPFGDSNYATIDCKSIRMWGPC